MQDHDKGTVVQIKTLRQFRTQRDERRVQFEIDGKQYNFTFVPSTRDVFSYYIPVYLVTSSPGNSPNYTFELIPETEKMVSGIIYVDDDKKAVVLAHYDKENKNILYDGLFGESRGLHLIKSLPENRRSRIAHQEGDHIIFKLNGKEYYYPELKRNMRISPLSEKLDKPLETFYPKILAVVDNHLFKMLGSDIAATIKYVATFWNAVDQKYLNLESPKVQIVLTGIIIANDETALNYVYQSRVFTKESADEMDKGDINIMYEKARMYFHHNFSKDVDFRNYDAAIVMSGLNLFPFGGITVAGKICDNWYDTAIIADDGEYGGVQFAAHELGHLLNIQHDSLSYDGKCPGLTHDGDVSFMSPINKEGNNLFWSDCSKNHIHEFAKVKASKCLETRYRQRNYE